MASEEWWVVSTFTSGRGSKGKPADTHVGFPRHDEKVYHHSY